MNFLWAVWFMLWIWGASSLRFEPHTLEAGIAQLTTEEKTTMPTALVHVGPHKTGTSHIQRVLGSQSDALHKMGIVYPIPPSKVHPKWEMIKAHHFVFRCLSNQCEDDDAERTNVLWQDTNYAAAENNHVILSSETAANAEMPALLAIKKELQPFNVEIVIFLSGRSFQVVF